MKSAFKCDIYICGVKFHTPKSGKTTPATGMQSIYIRGSLCMYSKRVFLKRLSDKKKEKFESRATVSDGIMLEALRYIYGVASRREREERLILCRSSTIYTLSLSRKRWKMNGFTSGNPCFRVYREKKISRPHDKITRLLFRGHRSYIFFFFGNSMKTLKIYCLNSRKLNFYFEHFLSTLNGSLGKEKRITTSLSFCLLSEASSSSREKKLRRSHRFEENIYPSCLYMYR